MTPRKIVQQLSTTRPRSGFLYFRFVGAACANAAGTIFAEIILDLFGKDAAKDHILHVQFETGKGENRRKFKATGLGRDVLKAMQEFDDHDILENTEEFDTGEIDDDAVDS
jgi:hypothetical protein